MVIDWTLACLLRDKYIFEPLLYLKGRPMGDKYLIILSLHQQALIWHSTIRPITPTEDLTSDGLEILLEHILHHFSTEN